MNTLRTVLSTLVMGLVASACAQQPTWADESAAPELSVSADGAFIVQHGTGLQWARCVEGTTWTGQGCSGTPLLMDRSEAIAWARNKSRTDGVLWRVPRVAELRKLVGKTGLDPRLFPDAPDGWYWSSTANVDTANVNPYNYGNVQKGLDNRNANHLDFLYGWAVNLGTGEARGDVARKTRLMVRLVREPR
jgi:hypothetical protein